MSQKQCQQCSVMVDEAKAFCPECGNPFVTEEARRERSEHDSFEGTIKLTQSGYNIMLSEMELDITEQPESKASRPAPADKPATGLPAPESAGRFKFIVIGAVLLSLAVIVLVFFVAQPFSK